MCSTGKAVIVYIYVLSMGQVHGLSGYFPGCKLFVK